ncbi:MAG: Trk system potassium transporter TrkA [Deltaproteobacteria bacterium]|nr:Trk system potassium transporter TrkA [Deltaproteobacteria bacterium]
MRILIVGAGVVGSNLAAELSMGGHVVSIVDDDVRLVRELNDRLDVLAIAGNGASPACLRRAGIEDAEMVIAVTNIDEVNLVICMLAHRFGVKYKVARIRNEEYSGDNAFLKPEELGIDTIINPEHILTSKLLQILRTPGATDISSFVKGQILLVTFDIDEGAPIAGKQLKEIRQLPNTETFLVAAIFRGEDEALVPRGDDEIRVGDHIAVIVGPDALPTVLPLMQKEVRQPQRVVIFGATMVGHAVAKALQDHMEKVVLIEPDMERAEEAATELLSTLVLQGEATDLDILREADIEHCDFFMALSRDDEANLLAALMARRFHAKNIAVMAQEPAYMPILSSLDMDVVLNSRLAAVGAILCFIRRGEVHMVTRIKESEAEVIELEAAEGAKVTKKPLKDLDLPEGSLIVAALRDDKVVIPGGDFQIQPHETVLVFALPEAIERIERIFSSRRLFRRHQ